MASHTKPSLITPGPDTFVAASLRSLGLGTSNILKIAIKKGLNATIFSPSFTLQRTEQADFGFIKSSCISWN